MSVRLKWIALVLFAVALGLPALAACTGPLPTPLPATVPPTALTAAGGQTLTVAPTPGSTDARPPAPTSSLAPTLEPTGTPTPTATAAASPTVAVARLHGTALVAEMEAAQRYETNGDYDQAISGFLAVLGGRPTAEQACQARYQLAESTLLGGGAAAAAAAWEQFINAYPDDRRLVQAHLMAARAYAAAGDCDLAVPHYEAAVDLDTTLADLIYEWEGDCRLQVEEPLAAVVAYRQGLEATRDASVEVGLREKIAAVYLILDQPEAAVAEYDAILRAAKKEYYRAHIEYLAGQALAAVGQTEAAQVRYLRAVDLYPSTESAYLALVELVNAEVPVDEFQRGLVDYYAGASHPDAYGAAVRAFDRYLAAKPAPKADEALYRKALAQRALDETGEALKTFDRLIQGYPRSQWLASAWFQKAAALATLGESDEAVRTYQDMAAYFPADRQAPQALWSAAKLREDERAYSKAAALYEDLQASFPAYADADQALWRAGLAYYRAQAVDRAVTKWQALVDKYPNSSYHSAALYWLGKVKAQSKPAVAKGHWDQLVASDPYGYYALRVRQIRARDPVTGERLNLDAVEPPAWDNQQAETEVLEWLRGWTQVPTTTRLISLPTTIADRADLQRGEALLSAGLRREALATYDETRSAAWNDPLALAQLAFYFRERGTYGLAARCASRLVGLWPGGVVQDAPPSVQRLAFPLVYSDLLSAGAQSEALDPLLLAALIRQESLFEPTAESYAGARGLGQVMPTTGEGIARSLGIQDFSLDDLYRPSVSVRFGAYYLGVQIQRFDGNILVALAAYNGGPGNALRWQEAAGDDLDLFVEVITLAQSRTYLQKVYEQYITYESLYR